MTKKEKALIFEMSVPGRTAYSLPVCDVEEVNLDEVISNNLLRDKEPELPSKTG